MFNQFITKRSSWNFVLIYDTFENTFGVMIDIIRYLKEFLLCSNQKVYANGIAYERGVKALLLDG